jgi:glutathione peroxidase
LTAPDAEAGGIQWDFGKFMLAPDGPVAARLRPWTRPDDPSILSAVEEMLPA